MFMKYKCIISSNVFDREMPNKTGHILCVIVDWLFILVVSYTVNPWINTYLEKMPVQLPTALNKLRAMTFLYILTFQNFREKIPAEHLFKDLQKLWLRVIEDTAILCAGLCPLLNQDPLTVGRHHSHAQWLHWSGRQLNWFTLGIYKCSVCFAFNNSKEFWWKKGNHQSVEIVN